MQLKIKPPLQPKGESPAPPFDVSQPLQAGKAGAVISIRRCLGGEVSRAILYL